VVMLEESKALHPPPSQERNDHAGQLPLL
jgi:hypothetical protein